MLIFSTSLFAQSLPSATLTGKVTADGATIPGVTVTVRSPQLQGSRITQTSGAGDYIIPLLPPGSYTVTFELSGMATVTRKLDLSSSHTESINIELRPASVSEAITVTAAAPSVIESTQVATNFKQDLIDELPVSRDIRGVTLLAPGVNSNGPGGNIIISGAMSFDSLYLVNGAVVNENLRGQPHGLFIEDAHRFSTGGCAT